MRPLAPLFVRNARGITIVRRFLSVLQTEIKAVPKNETAAPQKWQLAAGVCLERFPLIAPPLTEEQKTFRDFFYQLEVERSLLNDFELREIEEVKKEKQLQKLKETGKDDVKQKRDIAKTTKEQLYSWNEELRSFKFGSLSTDDDVNNNKKSLDRALARKLFLIVKEKASYKTEWELPRETHKLPETMRETAERALKQFVNPEETFNFYGNAPVGFLKAEYPKPVCAKLNAKGIKIFFFKVQLKTNKIEVKSDRIEDYLWLTNEELKNYLTKHYYKTVFHMFYE